METADDWTAAPFAGWLEDVIRAMLETRPESIAIEMITEDGEVDTCYYNVNMNDRDVMIGAMRDDNRMRWFKEHRGEILSILSDDWVDDENGDIDCEEDIDGLQEADK